MSSDRAAGRRRRVAGAAVVLSVAVVVLAACGSSGNKPSSSTGATSPSTNPSTNPSTSTPVNLSVDSFDVSFSAMTQLKSVTAAGSGMVGVILPDTTSSTRYVDFDADDHGDGYQRCAGRGR